MVQSGFQKNTCHSQKNQLLSSFLIGIPNINHHISPLIRNYSKQSIPKCKICSVVHVSIICNN